MKSHWQVPTSVLPAPTEDTLTAPKSLYKTHLPVHTATAWSPELLEMHEKASKETREERNGTHRESRAESGQGWDLLEGKGKAVKHHCTHPSHTPQMTWF